MDENSTNATSGFLDGTEARSLLVVKFRLIAHSSNMYGLGLIVFDRELQKIRRVSVSLGANVAAPDVDLGERWLVLEEVIMTERALGRTASSLSKRFIELVNESAADQQSLFFQALRSSDDQAMRNAISEIYNKTAGATQHAEIELVQMDLSEPDFKKEMKTGRTSSNAPALDQSMLRDMDEGVRLDCRLVLAPVVGTEVAKLQKGDRVLVTITDKRDLARYLAQLLATSGRGTEQGIDASVVNIEQMDPERYGVLVEFGPGILGIAKSAPEIRVHKVRHSDSRESVPASKTWTPGHEQINPEKIVPIVALLIIAGLALLMVILAAR